MVHTIFREYDIRGKIDSELKIDQVYDLARAIAFYFVTNNPQCKMVAVGMDGRTHSPLIKEHLCRALTDSGFNVVFIGTCTSPVLYFALNTMSVDAGIMITASHNPKEYNGFKISLGTQSVWGKEILKIRDLYQAKKRVESTTTGTITECDVITPYIEWFAQNFKHLIGMPLSAVIDCGNGAAGTVIPKLVERMGWGHMQLLYADVDGTYPNHEADPVKEENMLDVRAALRSSDAQVGIGLDGDADRMAPMTKDGYLVPGDKLLAIFSKQVLKDHPHCGVVMDIKSSAGLIELLNTWHAKPYLSPSGHSIIKKNMKEHNAILGGELSCHFFFADRYFGYDDGVYAMMRLFEILTDSHQSLAQLLEDFPHKISSDEFRIACAEDKKGEIVDSAKAFFAARTDATMITIDGVRATMPYGWGIIRASNTQPVLSLRFESGTVAGLHQVKQDFVQALRPYFAADVVWQLIGE